MNEIKKISIANALQSYRNTVLEHNLALLEIIIKNIEEQPDPDWASPKQAQETRMRFFAQFVLGGGDFQELPPTPRDLVSTQHRDKIVREYSLDGVFEATADTTSQRSRWFVTVTDAIAQLDLPKQFCNDQQARPAAGLPDELQYLCTLCDPIIGTGLPQYRISQQMEFLSSAFEPEGLVRERVMSRPHIGQDLDDDEHGFDDLDDAEQVNPLLFAWEGWDISVAVKLGDAPYPGGGFAVFCQSGSDRPWQWRYGVCDGDWNSELYDAVEGFLGCYARCKEQTEDDAREMVKPIEYLE